LRILSEACHFLKSNRCGAYLKKLLHNIDFGRPSHPRDALDKKRLHGNAKLGLAVYNTGEPLVTYGEVNASRCPKRALRSNR
jgi:hypothetical protein